MLIATAWPSLRHSTHSSVSCALALISWCGTKGGDVNEVTRSGLGGEFEGVAPTHAGMTFDHVNHAFQRAVVVCAGFGIGVDVYRAGPEFLGANPGKVDGRLAVHPRCGRDVAVKPTAGHHANTIVFPVGRWEIVCRGGGVGVGHEKPAWKI